MRKLSFAVALLLCGIVADGNAQPAQNATRGELLYSTHCIACHSSQVHWRDKSIIADWASLESQVSRWQTVTAPGWSAQDIAEVARHLNALHYHYSAPE